MSGATPILLQSAPCTWACPNAFVRQVSFWLFRMKIVVQGLWHLGCVTAACCAQHHQVLGLDFDEAVVAGLAKGKAPLFEPGLDDLIADGYDEAR